VTITERNASTTIVVDPVTPQIGADVTGVDLASDLSPEVVEVLRAALDQHLVLFFHDQQLSPAAHVAVGRCFGTLHAHPYGKNLGPEHPEIFVLDYEAANTQTVYWHADVTWEPIPPMGSVLRAVDLPRVGGDTLWASMYGAYDALSPAMKEFVNSLTAVHSSAKTYVRYAERGLGRPDAKTEMSTAVHPVVVVHPRTGRRALFVNQQWTERIVELNAQESDDLLATLFALVDSPCGQVRHRWSSGDVAIWDNLATQHFVAGGYEGGRLMHRVTMNGTAPRGVPQPTAIAGEQEGCS
jgi:taurine dioxygenase